ncbi:MAG TPA: hypothetical protein VME69_03655 [Methylocella sp.]|nr:hypothetical protein [Methylocella sp.]
MPYEQSQKLIDVGLGYMGHFKMSPNDPWFQKSSPWIQWKKEHSSAISQFRQVEDFLVNKMLFVGKVRQADGSIPKRGELKTPASVEFLFVPGQENSSINLNFNVVFTFYHKYEGLIVFLYANVSEISVDHLIILREIHWYSADNHSWKISYRDPITGVSKPMESLRHLISSILEDVLCPWVVHSAKQCPQLFSLIELRRTAPAWGFMNDSPIQQRLTPNEHWGLLSGDEGYRLIGQPDFDEILQFNGRRYFSYHFSPTNCIAFYWNDMGERKSSWADWYRENIANIPMLDSYIRLNPQVPCLADGIPLLIELCLLRYVQLTNLHSVLESELYSSTRCKALSLFRLPLWFSQNVFGLKSELEKSQSRLEQLDLYQDSALWIVGGRYTDILFGYSAVRERVERMLKTYQQVESEKMRFTLQVVGLLIAILSSIIGVPKLWEMLRPH